MKTGWTRLGIIVLSAATLGGCGSLTPPEWAGVSPSGWTTPGHCGSQFELRDPAGTQRLYIRPPDDFPTTGYPIGSLNDGGNGDEWSGKLEIGNGLRWGQCHDIMSDLDTEQIDEVWPAVGGAIEVTTEPAPVQDENHWPAVHIIGRDLELERPDGSTLTVDELEITNDSLGFPGG